MKYKRIGLMFAGQGAQTEGMGKDLADGVPSARRLFERIDEAAERPISALCFDSPLAELTCCANCQPAICAVSLASLEALRSHLPDLPVVACGGLSLGEYAALCTANVYSLSDTIRLVARRGELMDDVCRSTSGSMAAVLKLDAGTVQEVCQRFDLDIANYNCPGQLIISGLREKVSEAVAFLAENGHTAMPLNVGGAYHSRLMRPAAERFGEFIRAFSPAAPAIPLVQNVTGSFTENAEDINPNLAAQIAGSVRWESCARAMMARCDALVELGPGKVLCGLAKHIDRAFPVFNVCDCTSLEKTCAELT